MNYPKYKYHAELDPIVVEDEYEEESLGDGWKDSPADHGVITNPSKAEAHRLRMDELKKAGNKGRKEQKPAADALLLN